MIAAIVGCCAPPLLALTPKDKMMKELGVKRVSMASIPVESVPALLDKEKVISQPVNTMNRVTYPYCLDVKFRMVYADSAILIHYKVKENSIRAVTGRDNGSVWEDSCMGLFSVPAEDGVHYNTECNYTGRPLVGAGVGRSGYRHAPQEMLDKVQHWSSLGREDFEEWVGECSWEVALVIPYSAFFIHNVASPGGKTIRTNFYKCGDRLQIPHSLSWDPIDLEKPNLHCPEFFRELRFE